jgi:GNAT superfamily N-acetyltransferase
MELTYRLALEDDAGSLAQLRWDFRSYDLKDPAGTDKNAFINDCAAYFRQSLASGEWHCWVTEFEGQIIATLFIHVIRKIPKPTRFDNRFGYVSSVYTRPEYRSQGIGAALMEKAKAWGVEQDLEMFFLWPSQRSVPFYLRTGFHGDTEVLECPLREE